MVNYGPLKFLNKFVIKNPKQCKDKNFPLNFDAF